MHCVFSVLPPFVLTRFGAYYPPRVGKSRTLLREGVVDSRFVFSGGVTFVTHLFFAFSDTCTALVFAIQWYSNHVCFTGVQHLCVQHSVTTPVCTVQ